MASRASGEETRWSARRRPEQRGRPTARRPRRCALLPTPSIVPASRREISPGNDPAARADMMQQAVHGAAGCAGDHDALHQQQRGAGHQIEAGCGGKVAPAMASSGAPASQISQPMPQRPRQRGVEIDRQQHAEHRRQDQPGIGLREIADPAEARGASAAARPMASTLSARIGSISNASWLRSGVRRWRA